MLWSWLRSFGWSSVCASVEKKSTWRIWIYYWLTEINGKHTHQNIKYIFWIRYTFWHVLFRPDVNWTERKICKTKIMMGPSDFFSSSSFHTFSTCSCLARFICVWAFIYLFSLTCYEYRVNIESNCFENRLMCLNSNKQI